MQPYLESVSSRALRIRWISVQCYEMVLPGGKVLVTDPFYLDAATFDGIPEEELTRNQKLEKQVYGQTGFSVDEFSGADYILLNHVHGDHSIWSASSGTASTAACWSRPTAARRWPRLLTSPMPRSIRSTPGTPITSMTSP